MYLDIYKPDCINPISTAPENIYTYTFDLEIEGIFSFPYSIDIRLNETMLVYGEQYNIVIKIEKCSKFEAGKTCANVTNAKTFRTGIKKIIYL